MPVGEHPDGTVGVLRLELHVPAVLEVHEHGIIAVLIVVVVVVRVCGASAVLLLLLLLAGRLAFAAGASSSTLCPSRLFVQHH